MLYAAFQIGNCRRCFAAASGFPVCRDINNKRYYSGQQRKPAGKIHVQNPFSRHIPVKFIHISLIRAVGIIFHIQIHIVQNAVNIRIRISVLYNARRAEPGMYLSVSLPEPVVNQYDAVSVRFIIAEIIFLIILFRKNSDKLIIRHIRLDLSRVFLQRFIQRNENDVASRLLFSSGDQLFQTFLFFVRQHIRMVKYTPGRLTRRIRPLVISFHRRYALHAFYSSEYNRENRNRNKYPFKISEIFFHTFSPYTANAAF